VYFAGDTAAGPHFRMIREHFGPPTVALLPIGAYEPRNFMAQQHINPKEAVAAHLELGAAQSFGIHWGTFALTDEGMDAPRQALTIAASSARLPSGAFVALENGDAWTSRPP
jgi:L-ascorbate metabolism protein UlaG (beta-lactamase superfamily)